MIICNDIWAYLFGFFFGKTPLIKLSPKKTWEGYIGGGFATLVYAAIVSLSVDVSTYSPYSVFKNSTLSDNVYKMIVSIKYTPIEDKLPILMSLFYIELLSHQFPFHHFFELNKCLNIN